MWLTILWIVLIAAACCLLGFAVVARIVKKLHPMPIHPSAAAHIDGRLRQWVQPPERVIQRSAIQPGMDVLEVGPARGAVTVPLARCVGPGGTVVCLELQRVMLDMLGAKLARPEYADVVNVEMVCADAQKMPLEDASFDAAILVEVLGEVPDRRAAIRECFRVLRPEGLLAVTEMILDPDYSLPRTVERLCTEAGFRWVARSGRFWDYTLVFEKPADA